MFGVSGPIREGLLYFLGYTVYSFKLICYTNLYTFKVICYTNLHTFKLICYTNLYSFKLICYTNPSTLLKQFVILTSTLLK
jgi:hypothetical protein